MAAPLKDGCVLMTSRKQAAIAVSSAIWVRTSTSRSQATHSSARSITLAPTVWTWASRPMICVPSKKVLVRASSSTSRAPSAVPVASPRQGMTPSSSQVQTPSLAAPVSTMVASCLAARTHYPPRATCRPTVAVSWISMATIRRSPSSRTPSPQAFPAIAVASSTTRRPIPRRSRSAMVRRAITTTRVSSRATLRSPRRAHRHCASSIPTPTPARHW